MGGWEKGVQSGSDVKRQFPGLELMKQEIFFKCSFLNLLSYKIVVVGYKYANVCISIFSKNSLSIFWARFLIFNKKKFSALFTYYRPPNCRLLKKWVMRGCYIEDLFLIKHVFCSQHPMCMLPACVGYPYDGAYLNDCIFQSFLNPCFIRNKFNHWMSQQSPFCSCSPFMSICRYKVLADHNMGNKSLNFKTWRRGNILIKRRYLHALTWLLLGIV